MKDHNQSSSKEALFRFRRNFILTFDHAKRYGNVDRFGLRISMSHYIDQNVQFLTFDRFET